MRVARLVGVALCAVCVCADTGTTTAALDVSARWLEDFRRRLVGDSFEYGPPPARPTGMEPTTDGRRDGALLRDEYGLDSKDRVIADDLASRENGISRRDLRVARAPQRRRRRGGALADFEGGELDSHRKAFLDNLHELEDKLEPKYLQRKKQPDASNRGSYRKRSRKNIEDIGEEKPLCVEENGVRRYRVRMGQQKMLRNQFNDGLTWMDDVAHELSGLEDTLYKDEGIEDRPQNQNNGRLLYNQGRPTARGNDGYEANKLHYSDSQNVKQYNVRGNTEPHQDSDENRVMKARDVQNESSYQESRSSSSSEETASGESGEQTRELILESQEEVGSREEGRHTGGAGGERDEEVLADREASR